MNTHRTPKMMPASTKGTSGGPVLTPNRARMASYWQLLPEEEPCSLPHLRHSSAPNSNSSTEIVVLGPRPPRTATRSSHRHSRGPRPLSKGQCRPRSHSLAGIWPAHSPHCPRCSPILSAEEEAEVKSGGSSQIRRRSASISQPRRQRHVRRSSSCTSVKKNEENEEHHLVLPPEEEESMVIATTIPAIKSAAAGERGTPGKSKLPCRHHNKNFHHDGNQTGGKVSSLLPAHPPQHQQQRHHTTKASQRIGSSSNSTDDYGFLSGRARHHSLTSCSYQPASLQILPSSSQQQCTTGGGEGEGSGFVRGGYRRSSSSGLTARVSRSDAEDEDDPNAEEHPSFVRRRPGDGGAESSISASKRSSKLKRRKAYYKEKKEGRSRSLTQIDSLDPSLLTGGKLDMESKSGPISCSSEQVLLLTPPPDARVSPKNAAPPMGSSQHGRGKNRFFSSSTEEPAMSGGMSGLMYEGGGDSLNPPTTNLHSTQGSSDPNLNVSSSAAAAAAKKRSLLSLSSPRHQPAAPRQSRAPSGFISHEGSLKLKNTKHNRWSSLFSPTIKDNSKMDLLSHYLEGYEQYGIPRPSILPVDTVMESVSHVEEDWRLIVGNWNELSYRAKQQQSAIWELVESEAVYLRTLELLIDLFLACLYNLQAANILNDIDRDRIFSNICDVYKSNKGLWLDCMLPMVGRARATRAPFTPSELHGGFTHFSITCLPYIQYCLDQSSAQDYTRRMDGMNPLFKGYLAWCETRKECNRERLTDILVRPLQRLTKYSLLLKAILKYTDEPEERLSLEQMITSVERFVKSVNGALRSQQESERLHGIMDRIENYEVVETRDDELESVIKSHAKLNLFAPMPGCGQAKRWLIFEGDLRLRDSFSSKLDVHLFLFTDMLLICKPTTRKGEKLKVIRQPFLVDRLLTREFTKDSGAFGLVYLNEFGTADAALSLHSHESKVVKSWMENIRNARRLYLTARAKANANFDMTEVEVEDLSAAEALEEEENSAMIYLHSQSPREVSSRVSQLSSLLHSHSGSIEMNDSSRAVSFEQELRGSSLSSDDGNTNEQQQSGGAGAAVARSLSVETGNLRPSSPRAERRSFLSTSPTPNTLSVQIPCGYSGQSLPNLTSAHESAAAHSHSLTVPKSLSPTNRGVSYPPPSPRSLRRTKALLQSAKPPLQKSKHVANSDCKSPERLASLAASISMDATMISVHPHCTSVDSSAAASKKKEVDCTIDITPPSKDVSPVAPHPGSSFLPSPVSPSAVCKKEYPSPVTPEEPQLSASSSTYALTRSGSRSRGSSPEKSDATAVAPAPTTGIARRLARSDRLDTKRYYTAGVIEDIKKENSSDKDSSIHKRHSWNYGPQSQNPGGPHHPPPHPHGHPHHQLATDSAVLRNRHFFSCESMTSIRSSSGVSSTSSILHCISDVEGAEAAEEHSSIATTISRPDSPSSSGPRLHPDVRIAVSEPEDNKDEEDAGEEGDGDSDDEPYRHIPPRPERALWKRGTDNPAFEGEASKPLPRTSSGRKHFLMRDPVVAGQQSSSSDSGSTDVDPHLHEAASSSSFASGGRREAGGPRAGGSQGQNKSSNILDFILTDASIEASEV